MTNITVVVRILIARNASKVIVMKTIAYYLSMLITNYYVASLCINHVALLLSGAILILLPC